MSQKTKANRGPLIAAGVALAACLGTVTGVAYQENQATYANTVEGADAKRKEAIKPIDPEVIAKAEVDKKTMALALREKWRDAWPTKHKGELRAMLRADASDEAKLMAIQDKLPNLPSEEEAGFNHEDTGACGMGRENDPTAVCAGWIVRRPTVDMSNPQLVALLEKIKSEDKAKLQADFASHRDIVLLEVSSPEGNNIYVLWVSGRVTTRSYRPQVVYGTDGKPRSVPPVHHELLPPYDFLQEEKK